MSTTVDHLRIDHRVTVLQEFTDSKGTTMRPGESGILRGLAFDQTTLTIQMSIERDTETVALSLALKAVEGPRNGHMKEFFELGEYVPAQSSPEPTHADGGQTAANTDKEREPHSPREVKPLLDGDRLEDVEQEILSRINHIGAAASVAEMYAERMRAFQAEGNELRAVAAFKLAVGWMTTYASWATSGGEGAALSYERDKFHDQLVAELGYDPTEAQ